MGLAIATKSFECSVDDGLVHIILNQPDRGNPIDGVFCREFGQAIAELSERADARAMLLSARGRLFSVGGDLMSLVKQGDALPGTIRAWTADLHVAIARMVRMRAPVVAAVHGNVAGGSVSLMAAADLIVMAESARISAGILQDRLQSGQRIDDHGDPPDRSGARKTVLPARRDARCRNRIVARAGRHRGRGWRRAGRGPRGSQGSSPPARPRHSAPSSGCSPRPAIDHSRASSKRRQ
jgi:hypothetical protein